MKLTTTFKKLHEAGACTSGYRKLAKYLGGVENYGEETPIDILIILESNGFDDAVWSLRATVENSDYAKRLIAADFAESVLYIFESKRPGDDRPRKAIQAARDFANGLINADELEIARKNAYAAGYAAATATDYAATTAAYTAYAAYAAAGYATATTADYAAAITAAYTAATTTAYAAYAYAATTAADTAYATATDYAAAITAARKKYKDEVLKNILITHLSLT